MCAACLGVRGSQHRLELGCVANPWRKLLGSISIDDEAMLKKMGNDASLCFNHVGFLQMQSPAMVHDTLAKSHKLFQGLLLQCEGTQCAQQLLIGLIGLQNLRSIRCGLTESPRLNE